jgi:phage protein D
VPVADLSEPQVPVFDIIINGTSLPPSAHPFVGSVLVDESIALPSMFAVEIFSSGGLEDVNMWVDDDLFSIGNVMEVRLGYGDDLETLMIGEITGLEPDFTSARLPILTVRGYDRRHRLQKGRKTRTFVQQKDSDIAARIASEAGLSAETEDTGVTLDYIIQTNQTDLEFLQERARRIQYETVVYDRKLIFRPVKNGQSEILTLTMDDHLLEFRPRLSMARQTSDVSVRAWDPKQKEEIMSKAQAGDESSTMGGKQTGSKMAQAAFGSSVDVLSAQPLMAQAEADQIATALLNRNSLSLIEGEGLCYGRTDLRTGKVIKIDGVGKRFGGQYYVMDALHHYSAQDGYRTQFQVRRNAS